MAGARALWVANGMKKEMMGKPIIAIVNSFTQFVPGHTHLHEIGQQVKAEIEKLGCFAAEFNTIAIDDGIAMGHDGMLYSLPSRDIIADSVEYMVNAHKADAMVCISNCDKITPGMLMAAMRLNIPTVFVSGGPMEAGEWNNQHLDLIDAMIKSADASVSDEDVAQIEDNACPGCGCCSYGVPTPSDFLLSVFPIRAPAGSAARSKPHIVPLPALPHLRKQYPVFRSAASSGNRLVFAVSGTPCAASPSGQSDGSVAVSRLADNNHPPKHIPFLSGHHRFSLSLSVLLFH